MRQLSLTISFKQALISSSTFVLFRNPRGLSSTLLSRMYVATMRRAVDLRTPNVSATCKQSSVGSLNACTSLWRVSFREYDFVFFFPPCQHKELTGILILKYVLKLFFCFKTPARNNKRKRNFIIVNKHYDYVNEILIMFKNVISIETKAIMLMNIIFNANIFNDYGYDFNVFRFA